MARAGSGAPSGPALLRAAALLLGIIGAARGLGGIALALHGRAADPAILASPGRVLTLGALLTALGLFGVACGAGLWRLRRAGWIGGVAFAPLFFLDGLLNGWLLFGTPRPIGILANGLAAVILLALLLL